MMNRKGSRLLVALPLSEGRGYGRQLITGYRTSSSLSLAESRVTTGAGGAAGGAAGRGEIVRLQKLHLRWTNNLRTLVSTILCQKGSNISRIAGSPISNRDVSTTCTFWFHRSYVLL